MVSLECSQTQRLRGTNELAKALLFFRCALAGTSLNVFWLLINLLQPIAENDPIKNFRLFFLVLSFSDRITFRSRSPCQMGDIQPSVTASNSKNFHMGETI